MPHKKLQKISIATNLTTVLEVVYIFHIRWNRTSLGVCVISTLALCAGSLCFETRLGDQLSLGFSWFLKTRSKQMFGHHIKIGHD